MEKFKNNLVARAPIASYLEHTSKMTAAVLRGAAEVMEQASKQLEHQWSHAGRDIVALRGHLILEETAEALRALVDHDEVGLLDGICDACYVLVGTGLQFDLPVDLGFAEVHASNMTKQEVEQGPNRLRIKGPDFRPPNLAGAIEFHRDGRAGSMQRTEDDIYGE